MPWQECKPMNEGVLLEGLDITEAAIATTTIGYE